MHLALFGASGRTGQLLTELALTQGHTVAALVRTPATFPQRAHPGVRVVLGDAFNPAAIADTLQGADAVLSALGARSLRREDVLERAIPLIISAMGSADIRRIVALGSAGALPSAMNHQPAWQRWLVQNIVYTTALKWPVASSVAQYKALSVSNLEWTLALPPMLTEGPARGTYRIDEQALPINSFRISRADVAQFLFDQLASKQYVRQGVFVAW